MYSKELLIDVSGKKMNITQVVPNKLQRELFHFLYLNIGIPFTPIYLNANVFKHCSVHQIKYNLTKLTKKDIGVDEAYVCIKDSGYVYSNGYYYYKKL